MPISSSSVVRVECDRCGTVNAVLQNERYEYGECGIEGVWIEETPVMVCPQCGDFLGVEISCMAYLHSAIGWALHRRKEKGLNHRALVKRMKVYTEKETRKRWWYRAKGGIIECYRVVAR